MADQTTNFKLTKDADTEYYNVNTVNSNLDKIDKALGNTAIFETAGGTGTAITLTGLEFVNGRSKTFIVASNNNGAATTINGKHLYKPGTTSTPKLITGKAVTVWYSSTGDCFFIKASAEGTAVVGNVLAGKTFSNDDDTGLSGIMTNNGPDVAETINLTLEGAEYVIPEGYHSGLRKIKTVITGLIASVIKAGTKVGGILGTFTADANAGAGDMLSGKTCYVNGAKVTGNIPVRGSEEHLGWQRASIYLPPNPGRLHARIPTGAYIQGAGEQQGQMGVFVDDPDFIAGNIPENINMFGMQGTKSVINPDAGDSYLARRGGAYLVGDFYGTGIQVMLGIDPYSCNGAANWVRVPAPGLAAANIVKGNSILGMNGTAPRTATGSTTTTVAKSIKTNETPGSLQTLNCISVPGLTFKPRYIMVYTLESSNAVYMLYTMYVDKTLVGGGNAAYDVCVTGGIHLFNSGYYGHTSYRVNEADLIVNASGFTVPVTTKVNNPYIWVAVE